MDPTRWKEPGGGAPEGLAELLQAAGRPPSLPESVREATSARAAELAVAPEPLRMSWSRTYLPPIAAAAAVGLVGVILLITGTDRGNNGEADRAVAVDVEHGGAVANVLTGEAHPPPPCAPPCGEPDVRHVPAMPNSKSFGYLTIESEPVAEVFVDGLQRGTTPVVKVRVPAGKRTVRLQADGWSGRDLVVDVPANSEVRRRVRFDGGDAEDGAAAKQASKARYGYLTLNSLPWTQVIVDGRKMGATPLLRMKVLSGRHKVVFENQEMNCKRTIVVSVSPGEEVRQIVRCEPPKALVVDTALWDGPITIDGGNATKSPPAPVAKGPILHGRLTVNSVPWAKVYVDGRYVGNTPIFKREVLAGRHRVKLMPRGQEPSKTFSVIVPVDGEVSRTLRLASEVDSPSL